jgi:hypothetical protein
MICQGIYPYRSNSWRIFSHWIEKRISPPHPIQPVTGDTHSFSCVCRGEGRNWRKKSLLPKSKRYPLFIPSDLSQPSSYRYSLSLFSIFQFGRFWGGKEDEARTNGSSLLHVQASLIRFYSEKKKIHLVGRHRNIGWMLHHYQMTLRFFSNSYCRCTFFKTARPFLADIQRRPISNAWALYIAVV